MYVDFVRRRTIAIDLAVAVAPRTLVIFLYRELTITTQLEFDLIKRNIVYKYNN